MRFSLLIIAILSAAAVFAIPFELEPEASSVTPPSPIIIDILVTNSQQIYGFELQIADAPERATFSHIETTPRTSGALATSAIQGTGSVKIAVILSGTGTGIIAGAGSVLRVFYGVTSGNEEIAFTPSNVNAYDANGTLIPGITATATTVQLQGSSGGSSSSGSSGGGGSGGGSSSSSSSSGSGGSSSSASSSTSSFVPFSNMPEPAATEEIPVPQPPAPIEISTSEPEQPTIETAPPKKRNKLPYIIAVVIALIAGAMAYYFIKTREPILKKK